MSWDFPTYSYWRIVRGTWHLESSYCAESEDSLISSWRMACGAEFSSADVGAAAVMKMQAVPSHACLGCVVAAVAEKLTS